MNSNILAGFPGYNTCPWQCKMLIIRGTRWGVRKGPSVLSSQLFIKSRSFPKLKLIFKCASLKRLQFCFREFIPQLYSCTCGMCGHKEVCGTLVIAGGCKPPDCPQRSGEMSMWWVSHVVRKTERERKRDWIQERYTKEANSSQIQGRNWVAKSLCFIVSIPHLSFVLLPIQN